MSGFVAKWANAPKVERSRPEQLARERQPGELDAGAAVDVLNLAGVRVWREGAAYFIGLWSDLDTPEVRVALTAAGVGGLPVRHLDGDGVPERMKRRDIPERAAGVSWAAWKAAALEASKARRNRAGGGGQ